MLLAILGAAALALAGPPAGSGAPRAHCDACRVTSPAQRPEPETRTALELRLRVLDERLARPDRLEPTLLICGEVLAVATTPFLLGSVPLMIVGANSARLVALLAVGIGCAVVGALGLAVLVVAYASWRADLNRVERERAEWQGEREAARARLEALKE